MIRLGWLLPPVKEGDPHSWLAGVGEVGGSRWGWDKGIFPKQHQSRSWREGLVRQEGGKEGEEANGSEEGWAWGGEDRKVPSFLSCFFQDVQRGSCSDGPRHLPQTGGPGVYLLPTAEPAAAPAEREGSQQSKEGVAGLGTGNKGGWGTSPCRDWVGFSTYTLTGA